MSITAEELQQQLISDDQAVAANIVALINDIVDGKIALVDVDLTELESKVTALNTLLDGDPNNEGYQAFQSLVDRLTAVETVNTEQATTIAAIQASITNHGTRITDLETSQAEQNTRLTSIEGKDVEQDGRLDAIETKDTAQDSRLDALEAAAGDNITRQELATDFELSGQAFINTLWAGRTRPAGLPNTDDTVSA